ncbi:sulfite exporter TauE/SafE family protein [Arthrobacter sp. STN4]|uniref:sulfite exporter TauE/SafE family protein n=1 Tax=Arthrobacter sp. STN4 TaxID=2923276 RepID=UPI002119C92A|nr:sulfite exporter TauE/SafE family protein [Arthrobacter sp. STN4]MCQ9163633.1 sulfite exporter TauE/SafE family protein [Arthrobacter sp. STN4]
MDIWMGAAAFGVGIVVGLTGMGGGALMTPALVLVFGVPPLAAVSSDLVASAVMKPVGSLVHLRRRTVNLELVKWLAAGSVPAAFGGVLILKWMGPGDAVQDGVRNALGGALLLSATLLAVRSYLKLVQRSAARPGPPASDAPPRLRPRPVPTVLLGMLGGVVVGMTSVGSGSIIIIGLMALYPAMKASQLVGTDLLQAVPLVAAAALGHTLFGDLDLALTVPLLLGSIPGVYLGAQLSSRLSGGIIRRALAFVLLASGLKMLDFPDQATAIALALLLLAAPLAWMAVRRRHGLPALATTENRRRRAAAVGTGPAEGGTAHHGD